jgi:hypothetical protein
MGLVQLSYFLLKNFNFLFLLYKNIFILIYYINIFFCKASYKDIAIVISLNILLYKYAIFVTVKDF